MSDPLKFFSSGGLGDAWIAFLKIISEQRLADQTIVWNHMTSHIFHKDSILQLMELMPGIQEGKVRIITKATMDDVERFYVDDGGFTTRLRSTAYDIPEPTPCLDHIIERAPLDKSFAVIQPAAGRDDKSFRYFTPYAVNTLIANYHREGKKVVLLGYKYSSEVPKGVANMTGKTSIPTAMSIIASASDFIGFDGFLAYVAMSMKVRSRVAFHMPGLSHHYVHPKWREHSEFCLTYQKISEPFCLNWGQV